MENSRVPPSRSNSSTSPNDGDNSSSIARGRETRTALLQKLRPPPLVHAWDFWYEKPTSLSNSRKAGEPLPASTAASSLPKINKEVTAESSLAKPISTSHSTTLTHLHSITDVRHFWSLFNNFSFSSLQTRVAVHLFHSTVRPLWEDPRNASGGSWTFRVPRTHASPFFRSLAILAIGEQLQEAVYDERKTAFRDDICGISMSVRGEKTCNVSVWNRDGGNEAGKKELLQTIMQSMPAEVTPVEGSYYYKRHNEHVGFSAHDGTDTTRAEPKGVMKKVGQKELEEAQDRSQEVNEAVSNVEKEYEKVRKILEEVRLKDEEMDQKLAREVSHQAAHNAAELATTTKENEVEAGVVD